MTRKSTFLLIAISATAVLARGQELNPVHWNIAEKNVKAAPGQALTVHITAEIESEWHLYGLKKIEGGPNATTLTVEKGQSFQSAGDIGASPAVSAYDEAFGMNVEYYLGKAHFELPLRVPADGKPGQSVLKVVARYQMCNDTLCLPPKRVTLELPAEIEKVH
jgi:hypothetical protein